MTELDLTDPAVRRMAEQNHWPDEVWTVASRLLSVHCRACNHAWPCPTVVRLRGLDAERFPTVPGR